MYHQAEKDKNTIGKRFSIEIVFEQKKNVVFGNENEPRNTQEKILESKNSALD